MKKALVLLVLPAPFLLSACVPGFGNKTSVAPPPPAETGSAKMVYDQNSWKEMVPKDCLVYFDGCNNCNRVKGEDLTACTRKFCANYQEPRCLDLERQ